MDKEKFKQLTQHLIRYNAQEERDVLIPNNTPRQCEYCPRQVSNQLITCEPHKLGSANEHFKHKCHACRHTVYDGSYVKEPNLLRPFSNYTPSTKVKILPGTPPGPKYYKNGSLKGRPPKPKQPKRAVGRPRKPTV